MMVVNQLDLLWRTRVLLHVCSVISLIIAAEASPGSLVEFEVEAPGEYYGEECDCRDIGDRSLDIFYPPWGHPRRAYLTIPEEVEIRKSNITGGGIGVFSRTFIRQWTWLGEYEGEVVVYEDNMSNYAFTSYRDDELTHWVDAYDIRTSAWPRWINCAQTPQQLNTKAYYCYGRVFIMSSRDIRPGEELFLYYSHGYAKYLGIDTKPFRRANVTF